MAEKKKMSVAEILAAARKADGSQGKSAEPAESAASEPAAPSDPSSEQVAAEPVAESAPPATPKPAKLAPGERPALADILAMARSGGKGAAPKPAAVAKTKPQPPSEAKPAAESKPAAKAPAKSSAPAKPVAAARLDTASILAAARSAEKPGPVTKAEAAQRPDVAKPKAPAAAKLPVPPMPQKPAYAQPKGAKSPSAQSSSTASPEPRRRFVLLGVLFGSWLSTGFTVLTTTVGVWTLATARFMFPNILTEPPSKFKVGFPDEFPPGQVNEKFKSQYGVWVVNYQFHGAAEIYALSTVCTHLGCTPNWLESEQKFKCPCHGSGFYKDGINFEGPAPRPLERFAIRVAEDGQLEVDKSRKFQEEMGQWEDPSCFVPV